MTGDMGGEMKVTARSELCSHLAQFARPLVLWGRFQVQRHSRPQLGGRHRTQASGRRGFFVSTL